MAETDPIVVLARALAAHYDGSVNEQRLYIRLQPDGTERVGFAEVRLPHNVIIAIEQMTGPTRVTVTTTFWQRLARLTTMHPHASDRFIARLDATGFMERAAALDAESSDRRGRDKEQIAAWGDALQEFGLEVSTVDTGLSALLRVDLGPSNQPPAVPTGEIRIEPSSHPGQAIVNIRARLTPELTARIARLIEEELK